ncbi:MAG: sugar phosphate isomerase/epimerase family protein [Planctomycetales bacterium]
MRVQVACHTNSFGRFGPRGAIEHLKETGLDAIELPISTHGVKMNYGEQPLLTNLSEQADVKAVQALLDRHGIKVVACNVNSGNPAIPANKEMLKKKLDLAHQLGVNLVVGSAGEAHDDKERSQVIAALREIGDYCGKKHMTYCCDTLPGLCANHRVMQKTIEDVKHQQVRLAFDTGNLLFYNPEPIVEVALSKVASLVKLVRLKDSMGEQSQWYFPALGYGGAVDFLRVLQLMKEVNFKGPFVVSVDGLKRDEQIPIVEHQHRLTESLESLRDCGYFDA